MFDKQIHIVICVNLSRKISRGLRYFQCSTTLVSFSLPLSSFFFSNIQIFNIFSKRILLIEYPHSKPRRGISQLTFSFKPSFHLCQQRSHCQPFAGHNKRINVSERRKCDETVNWTQNAKVLTDGLGTVKINLTIRYLKNRLSSLTLLKR